MYSLKSQPLADAVGLKLVDLLDQIGLSKHAAALEAELKPASPLDAQAVRQELFVSTVYSRHCDSIPLSNINPMCQSRFSPPPPKVYRAQYSLILIYFKCMLQVYVAHYEAALLDMGHGLESATKANANAVATGRLSMMPQRSQSGKIRTGKNGGVMRALIEEVAKHLHVGVTFAVSLSIAVSHVVVDLRCSRTTRQDDARCHT